MKQCKCGSYAVNDDPEGQLCDRCWRDRTIDRLRKELAEQRTDKDKTIIGLQAEIASLKTARGSSHVPYLQLRIERLRRKNGELQAILAERYSTTTLLRNKIIELRKGQSSSNVNEEIVDYQKKILRLQYEVERLTKLLGQSETLTDGHTIAIDMRDACKRNTTLPQIEDLHGIDITGGEMPEDYVRKMRGG